MALIEQNIGKTASVKTGQTHLLSFGLEHLETFTEQVRDLERTLDELAVVGGPETEAKANQLKKQLREISPNITMIGQIKAGKTSLTNAMVGHPGLLPADVNPWTSVVTSLHLNASIAKGAPAASFQFFDLNEWDRLVKGGGRLGELAQRAGADDELQKVQEQIAKMREKTRARLGRKFELILGQKHDYGYFDSELVQRYVCMGDDFEDADAKPNQQGRFADITKSANLFFDIPDIPMGMCIKDTPGVNDTFMMREQVTINALRDSDICVVVLSAHQALTTMDMALIRLISNVKSREILIFVNRIDELSDPAEQIPEIRSSIMETLKKNNGPKDAHVIFGSAYWANIAMMGGGVNEVNDDSAAALFNWAEVAFEAKIDDMPSSEIVWRLSGVPDLYQAISERICEGVGQRKLAEITKRAINLAQGVQASIKVVQMQTEGSVAISLNKRDLIAKLDAVEPKNLKRLDNRLDEIFSAFSTRIDQSNARFLDRALASLMQHLDANGKDEVWQYSPDGLRMLLRSSYYALNRKYVLICDEIFAEVADELEKTFEDTFNVSIEGFKIEPPSVVKFPSPVTLGQTIALDLQSGWWKDWWQRRRGYKAFSSGFYDLIKAEVEPIISDLKGKHVEIIHQTARDILHDFIIEQRNILMDVVDKVDVDVNDLDDLFGIVSQKEQSKLINAIFVKLDAHAA